MTTPRRALGLTFDDRPIFEPPGAGSSITFAAAGGGKTTCVSLPAFQSLLADTDRALIFNDVKNGEITAQIAPVCEKYGRKLAVIDDFKVLGETHPHRISLNPFSALQSADDGPLSEFPFLVENMTHTAIDEPTDDAKGFFWREKPRQKCETAAFILRRHNPGLLYPGGLYALLSDPMSWNRALEIEAEEGEPYLRSAARQLIEMREYNPEHYYQHLQAALTALKIFGHGVLHTAGRDPDVTHAELLRENYVVCLVNPVRYADRLGTYFAFHFQSFMHEQLSGKVGRADYILDEFCNAPLRDALNRVTIQRGFGARTHFIAQSRQDIVRKYGEKETALLEENCPIKQWLKFTNFEEAERVSRAIGDSTCVSHGLGVSSDRNSFSGSFSTGKERLFTPDELMRLPPDEQILHVVDVGFIHCRKIRQNQIAPTCYDLGDNPLEGGRLIPNPKVTLPVPKREGER